MSPTHTLGDSDDSDGSDSDDSDGSDSDDSDSDANDIDGSDSDDSDSDSNDSNGGDSDANDVDTQSELCGCRDDAEAMLLCGDGDGQGCDKGFHMFCLCPRMLTMPGD
jgi:hypothetical protein